ncbi:MAG: hypothetical protein JW727_04375 [Candidatus Aenigmarchaeota archaeon]|nr:hypothetical protein [Candidatus Aenigmarchaeota archaeon]
MKGDFRIINEILLFGITAMVVFSVAALVSYSTAALKAQTQREQYFLMSDLASVALTKAYMCGKITDCSVLVMIPERLSEDRYTLSLENGKIQVSNFETGLGLEANTIDYQKNTVGFVTSNGRYFVIENRDDSLVLTR